MEFVAGLTYMQWLAIALAAALIGLARAGLDGGPLLAVPLLAGLFGPRLASSIMLGIMLTGDLAALWKFRSHGSITHLARTLPYAVAGIFLGVVVGNRMPEDGFKAIVGILILASAVIMFGQDLRGGRFTLPERWYFAAPLGLLSGFASMLGNAGGPIMGLFLLSSGLGKTRLIGTMIWFFFIINMVKLPFHVLVWHTLTLSTLLVDLFVAPVVIAAVLGGAGLVKLIPEKPYRSFRLAIAAIGGAYLLFA
jgi:uncharacterized protein